MKKAMTLAPTDRDMARFWAKVALPDASGCLLWTAARYRRYGMFSLKPVGGARDTTIEAHRFSCLWFHGLPPTSLHEAAHSCRNRHCVAPAHLRWATPAENAADRLRDGTDARGEKCPTVKLTEDQVRAILSRSGERRKVLAEEFGVSRQTINDIIWGRTWPHLGKVWNPEVEGRRTMTPEEADEMRRRYAAGGVTQTQLAAEYRISQSRISALILMARQVG